MGIGSMVGAGIFALMGEAGSIAGTASYLSFFIGGIIALSSGYSYAKLGSKFPSEGGVIEYLYRGFKNPTISGTFSILFLFAQIVTMAMVAKTFGSYFYESFTPHLPKYFNNIYLTAIVLSILLLNCLGSSSITKAESFIVIIKVSILCLFVVASAPYVKLEVFAPSHYPPMNKLISSLAITYFAYTGFAVITNSANQMENPKKQLPVAIFFAIGFTIILYVGLSIIVFGNLSVSEVIKYKDTALAQAAKPIFGSLGFKIIAFSALLATTSALNATMFSVLRMTDQEAEEEEISTWFLKRIWKKGTTGIIYEATITIILANFVDMTSIASLASLCVIAVTLLVHMGHLSLTKQTGANRGILYASIIANAFLIIMFVYSYLEQKNYMLPISLAMAVGICFILEKYQQIVDQREGKKST